MVLLTEILLLAGIVVGVVRLAARPDEGMASVEPDRAPRPDDDAPLTADDLVAYRLPAGVGYRKVDVDRLLDRLARQLPRAGDDVDAEAADPPTAPAIDASSRGLSPLLSPEPTAEAPPTVSLTKYDAVAQEERHG